jgi:hypothetical protein
MKAAKQKQCLEKLGEPRLHKGEKRMERDFRWETCFWKQDSPALTPILLCIINKRYMNSKSTFFTKQQNYYPIHHMHKQKL